MWTNPEAPTGLDGALVEANGVERALRPVAPPQPSTNAPRAPKVSGESTSCDLDVGLMFGERTKVALPLRRRRRLVRRGVRERAVEVVLGDIRRAMAPTRSSARPSRPR